MDLVKNLEGYSRANKEFWYIGKTYLDPKNLAAPFPQFFGTSITNNLIESKVNCIMLFKEQNLKLPISREMA